MPMVLLCFVHQSLHSQCVCKVTGIAGVLCRVPDHWPSDYEVKLRVMAKEFQIYKQLPANKRDTATTHLWSRTRFENANVNVAPEE